MSTNRNDLQRAVHALMNDVVEQCFQYMVHHPNCSEQLNQIIRDASDEIQYQLLKIDAHSFQENSEELEMHYRLITKEVNRKSLVLLSKLQKLQYSERA